MQPRRRLPCWLRPTVAQLLSSGTAHSQQRPSTRPGAAASGLLEQTKNCAGTEGGTSFGLRETRLTSAVEVATIAVSTGRSDGRRPCQARPLRRPRPSLPWASRLLGCGGGCAVPDAEGGPGSSSACRARRYWRLCRAGVFPKPVRISAGRVAFVQQQVENWMNARASAGELPQRNLARAPNNASFL